MNCLRTNTCGELRASNVGQDVVLSGWIYRKRDHGSILFVDLRDRYGIVQLVFDECLDSTIFDLVSKIRLESVIRVQGIVVMREGDTVNNTLATGEVEVRVSSVFVYSEADPLPFSIAVDSDYPESLRLQYRYLDLRREKPFKNIMMRSEIIRYLRSKMHDKGFIEVQTPILTASSPEGARDYLVPSRLHQGKFYALPQAPQQFKQLLMVAGFDKYFQIAPCFRDEDARADRSVGDFYQLDIEMSFVTQDEIFAVMEEVITGLFSTFATKKVYEDFPRISYDDALLMYASDKPDLRNPITVCDITDAFRDSGFKIFCSNISAGMTVRAIPAPGAGKMPRSFFDKVLNHAQSLGAKGLAYITFDQLVASGPIAKFLDAERINKIIETCRLNPDDAVFFSSAPMPEMLRVIDGVRQFLGRELQLIEDDVFKFCWITDFPYFEMGSDGKLQFSHNPFSMPKSDIDGKSTDELLGIRAYQYDIVCNGIELSSGAIRNHNLDLLLKAFSLVGYSKEDVEMQFPGIVSGFKYGVPPHGGIAPGIDRMVMLITGESNIREVVCFPFNQVGEDLMMNAPSVVDDRVLNELGLKRK